MRRLQRDKSVSRSKRLSPRPRLRLSCMDLLKIRLVRFVCDRFLPCSWFNISRRPDWVATRLFFQSRATAMRKGLSAPGSDDKCGFISIGTGSYDLNPTLLQAYRSDPEAATKINLDDYVLNMKASAVFEQVPATRLFTSKTCKLPPQCALAPAVAKPSSCMVRVVECAVINVATVCFSAVKLRLRLLG